MNPQPEEEGEGAQHPQPEEEGGAATAPTARGALNNYPTITIVFSY